jgi:uncharacterized protein (DUF433 family)
VSNPHLSKKATTRRTIRRHNNLKEEGEQIMANLNWSQCSAVESVPGRRSGAWVFKDTRMPISTVFENLESGATIDEIMEWFDVSREQIIRRVGVCGP